MNNMTESPQLRGKLSVECLYEACHKDGNNILGRRIWKSDMSMCMYDMERMQAMSLHDECLAMFVYV
jgi:hypothetical protein